MQNFITATITQHWNDPSSSVFRANDGSLSSTTPTCEPSDTISTIRTAMADGANLISPSQRRMWDDTSKRIDYMVERIQSQQVSLDVHSRVDAILSALNDGLYDDAEKLYISLATSPAFEHEGRWLIGVKRLIDILKTKST